MCCRRCGGGQGCAACGGGQQCECVWELPGVSDWGGSGTGTGEPLRNEQAGDGAHGWHFCGPIACGGGEAVQLHRGWPGAGFCGAETGEPFCAAGTKGGLGNLAVEREFNDVALVCGAYLRLMVDGEVGGTYNICSGVPHALESVVDTLAELTGHKMAVEVNPAFVRANEVFRLCGDPSRLVGVLGADAVAGGADLRRTLATMLSAMDPVSGRWLGAGPG